MTKGKNNAKIILKNSKTIKPIEQINIKTKKKRKWKQKNKQIK